MFHVSWGQAEHREHFTTCLLWTVGRLDNKVDVNTFYGIPWYIDIYTTMNIIFVQIKYSTINICVVGNTFTFKLWRNSYG